MKFQLIWRNPKIRPQIHLLGSTPLAPRLRLLVGDVANAQDAY